MKFLAISGFSSMLFLVICSLLINNLTAMQLPQETVDESSNPFVAPVPTDITVKRDLLNKIYQLNEKCEKVLDGITEHEHRDTDDDAIPDTNLSILLDLQYQIIKTACLKVVYATTASERAAVSHVTSES